MDAITADLGGPDGLTGAQGLLLATIRSKMIVLLQVSDWIDKQIELVDNKGNVPPVLNYTFIRYSDTLRRDLEVLLVLARNRSAGEPPTLEAILRGELNNRVKCRLGRPPKKK
jgi:hypothetical protein